MTRRALLFGMLAVGTWAILSSLYRELVAQSLSQGFVLENVEPIFEMAILLGEKLNCWGNSPLFAFTVYLVASALLLFCLHVFIRQKTEPVLSGTWAPVTALAFIGMCLVGTTDSFALYCLGLLLVPALGVAAEKTAGDHATGGRKNRLPTAFIMVCIVLLALIIRLYKLDIFPRIYTIDEQLFAHDALQLFNPEEDFLGAPSWVKAHLVKLLLLRSGFFMLGVGMFQQRTVSVVEGVACVVLVYFLCRKVWGTTAGIFASLMVALDSWHIGYSKFGNHFIEGPTYLVLMFFLIIRAVRIGGMLNAGILGLAIGGVSYLYQSCYALAPFALAAVAAGRASVKEIPRSALVKEGAVLAFGALVAVIPHLTFGRANFMDLFSAQTAPKNFLYAAKDYNFHPAFMLLVSFWRALEQIINWSPRPEHPSSMFYPSAPAIGLALLGLGILIGSRRRFENVLLLAWLPVAFLPVAFGYGFADRRIFTTIVPVPSILAALALARWWDRSGKAKVIERFFSRMLLLAFVIGIGLVSVFIVYKDSDPLSGGGRYPRKAAEFVNSLPTNYTVLISGRLRNVPFLLYMVGYDRLQRLDGQDLYSFVDFETLSALKEKVAASSDIAVVVDAGPEEAELMGDIKRLNPEARLIESNEYLALLID